MPLGSEQQQTVSDLIAWSKERSRRPILFGIEPADLVHLDGWSIREIGRQPLFRASSDYSPTHRGSNQPAFGREIRRQARRALAKGVSWQEISAGKAWCEQQNGNLTPLLLTRWKRQPLAEFSFLVSLHLSNGQQFRRYFLLLDEQGDIPLGIAIVLKSGRGWLIEHQIILKQAPNGSGELLLCHLLAEVLEPEEMLSLGITPLYRALIPHLPHRDVPAILSFMPSGLREWLVSIWEPLYGFKRLQGYREKLEPLYWEPVYWASYQGSPAKDLLAVLRAFAGGSIFGFAFSTLKKLISKISLLISPKALARLNTFYIISLCLWIPILWFLKDQYLFGTISSPKAWALYDLVLVLGFWAHSQTIKSSKLPQKVGGWSYTFLGMVIADGVLSLISTGLYLRMQSLKLTSVLWLTLLNGAPLSAVLFLVICYSRHPSLLRYDQQN